MTNRERQSRISDLIDGLYNAEGWGKESLYRESYWSYTIVLNGNKIKIADYGFFPTFKINKIDISLSFWNRVGTRNLRRFLRKKSRDMKLEKQNKEILQIYDQWYYEWNDAKVPSDKDIKELGADNG